MNFRQRSFNQGLKLGWLLPVAMFMATCTGESVPESPPTVAASGTAQSSGLPPPASPSSQPTRATDPLTPPAPTSTPVGSVLRSNTFASTEASPAALPGVRRRTPFVPLDNPRWLAAQEASYLLDDDLVLGSQWQGQPRAYPVRMLRYHHIVNDSVAGKPILITY